jgi:hypothetical protein
MPMATLVGDHPSTRWQSPSAPNVPPTSKAEDGALDEEGRLIKAALVPPQMSCDVATRPRPLELMDEASRSTFCLVPGEPASGIPSLVIAWLMARADDRSFACPAAPDEMEDDIAFWRYLLASIEPVGVDVPDLDAALLDRDSPGRHRLTVLANRLGDLTAEPLIVIDDLHELFAQLLRARLRLDQPSASSNSIAARARCSRLGPRWVGRSSTRSRAATMLAPGS